MCEGEDDGRRRAGCPGGDVWTDLRSRQTQVLQSLGSLSTRHSHRPKDLSSPVIAVDHQACILCDRCIRACDDIQCNEVIGRTGKGYATRIGFDLDNPMGESTCVSCGECVAACPTGALTNKPLTLPLVPRGETTERRERLPVLRRRLRH